ncbi:hypothetical protein KQH61_04820 [bacterium]|nr:hypothetical protein [bacterium]MCB2179224.1 hypothetical protein [bacterium]
MTYPRAEYTIEIRSQVRTKTTADGHVRRHAGHWFKETGLQAKNLHPEQQQILKSWAGRLQQWRVHQVAATLLEASRPLNTVGAQLVYITQPILSSLVPQEKIITLAELLEEPSNTQAFIRYLREEAQ